MSVIYMDPMQWAYICTMGKNNNTTTAETKSTLTLKARILQIFTVFSTASFFFLLVFKLSGKILSENLTAI